ncbi:MAG: hypothetical protein U1F36_19955 [Planctomycetota bacterium]
MSLRLFASALFLATPLVCQSNAIPGLDAMSYDVTDIAFYGRRGAAYPNGEAGFVAGHSYCNSGAVNFPWVSTLPNGQMTDTYPKIAFLLVRESNGRMVQVSGRSYLKHSPTPYNFSSGPCAPCNSGSGAFMFTGCSDTYGSGINSNRIYFGPTEEINPWLGTFASVGSYFDRGDPPVSGASANDNVKSLNSTMINAFDAVKNRIIVPETELIAGTYWTQAQIVIQGEPGANRGNNTVSRQTTISGTGGNWNASTVGSSSVGPVLTHWTGASNDVGGNGNDDGHFMVAVKITGPVAGMWHYEYAVHNLDNNRAGGGVHIPMDLGATVANIGFHDIDNNPATDWTSARVGTELVFTAPAGNAIEWNTLYNFWFDCSVAPSYGIVLVDEARAGTGQAQVSVNSQVPSGIPTAYLQTVGTGCGSCDTSFYEEFASATGFDLANSSMTLSYANGNYGVGAGTGSYVTPTGTNLSLGDDSEATVTLPFSLPYPGGSTNQLWVCSNGFVSPAGSNGTSFTPSASAMLSGLPRWCVAWHDLNPGAGGQVIYDSTPTMARVTWLNVPNFSGGGQNTFQMQFLPNGTVHVLWRSMLAAGNGYVVGWSSGASSDPGNRDLSATLAQGFQLCNLHQGGLSLGASARPILGTTIQVQTSNIPSGTSVGATLLAFAQAIPPIDLTAAGMPGCYMHTLGTTVDTLFAAPGSSYQFALPIPGQIQFASVALTAQTFTVSPGLTPLGVIGSNGLVLVLGLQ